MALVILRKKRLLWVIFGLVGILYLVISVSRKLSNGDQTSIIHQQEVRKSPSVASATHRKVIKKVPNIWARKKRPRVTRAPLNDKFQELAQQWKEKSFMGVDEYIYYSIGRLKLKPIKESVPLRPDFGPVVNDVTSFRYPINVQGCKSEQLVFIAVISAVKNFDKRQTIRQTWMQHLDGKVATVAFIVGLTSDLSIQQKLEEESAAHGDIIQIDSIDSFKFLTMKVVTLLNWLYRYCPSVPFALKCDDDVYVNVRNLLTVVRALPTKELSIYGRRHGNLDIQRDPTATWYVSYETWPWSSFPIFLSGGCVLISGKAISPLLAAAQTTPYLLTVDNVYLGGLLARKAGVPLRMSDEGIFSPGIRNMTDPCFFSGSVTWLTSSLDEMKDSHKATEDVLYRKKTRCFIHSEDGQTQKPDHVVEMFYKVADDYFVPFKAFPGPTVDYNQQSTTKVIGSTSTSTTPTRKITTAVDNQQSTTKTVAIDSNTSMILTTKMLEDVNPICPVKDGFYAFPGKCIDSYYACIKGVPYTQTCPAGSLFDPIPKICAQAENVSCKT